MRNIFSIPGKLLLATGFAVIFTLTMLAHVIPVGIAFLCGIEVNEP